MAKTKLNHEVISMTGFGRADLRCAGVSIHVEIKSVNNRYQDLNLRLPREYSSSEPAVRERLASLTGRGRLDLQVSRELGTRNSALEIDQDRIIKIYKSYALLANRLKVSIDSTQALLAAVKRSENCSTESVAGVSQAEERALLRCVDLAIGDLMKARGREGAQLGADILKRIAVIRNLHQKLEKLSESVRMNMSDRFAARLARIAPDVAVDPARFAAEVVLLVDRLDVSEELVRLKSHFLGFEDALRRPPNGRKLDFLVQEIGREFNTIGSKAQDAPMQAVVVDAKTELERIREQVQNLQ